jgi:hypothetical protein
LQPKRGKGALTVFQANLLVAMLGGFWARKLDGHPGPELMGRGLLILSGVVWWEKIKRQRGRGRSTRKEGRRKRG